MRMYVLSRSSEEFVRRFAYSYTHRVVTAAGYAYLKRDTAHFTRISELDINVNIIYPSFKTERTSNLHHTRACIQFSGPCKVSKCLNLLL